MNVALGAFIITLLFLPAISFRLAINRLEDLKGLLSTLSMTDSIWVFTVIPILIHIILMIILRSLHFAIKLDLLLNITYANAGFPLNNYTLGKDLVNFLGYNLLAISTGFLLGFLINNLEQQWGVISHLLGRGNKWYETFEGDPSFLSGEKINSQQIDFIHLDVLVNTKESSVLYSGLLVKYYFKPKSAELEYLVLHVPRKRDLRKAYRTDSSHIISGKLSFYDPNPGEASRIKSNYLIIPLKEVLNINITYLCFTTADEAPDQAA